MRNKDSIMLSTDCVLVSNGKLLMTKRAIEPFKDSWVLPGGHVEYGEKVRDALLREVEEETGIVINEELYLIDVFSEKDRDPRGHTVSCAFFVKVSKIGNVVLNKEADDFRFFDFDNLPDEIGFDHRKIIKKAYKKFINNNG